MVILSSLNVTSVLKGINFLGYALFLQRVDVINVIILFVRVRMLLNLMVHSTVLKNEKKKEIDILCVLTWLTISCLI